MTIQTEETNVRDQLTAQTPAGRYRLDFRRYYSPYYVAIGLVMAVLVPLEIVWCRIDRLGGLSHVWGSVPSLVMLVACLAYCHWRPLPKLIEVVEMVIVTVVLSTFLSVLVQLAGRNHHPMVDHQLAWMDRWAGVSTVAVVHWIAGWPVLRLVLALTYNLTIVFMVAALIIPSLMGRVRWSQQFILSVTVALFITVALFWQWPSLGPWSVEGYSPTKLQWSVAQYLLELRSGVPLQLDMARAGIVTFPSFHATLALLCAVAVGSVRQLRTVSWVLMALVCVSTVALGWHYFTDVAAGLLVGGVALAITYPIVHRVRPDASAATLRK
jgi:membrane-associated phospholipid phosphatase